MWSVWSASWLNNSDRLMAKKKRKRLLAKTTGITRTPGIKTSGYQQIIPDKTPAFKPGRTYRRVPKMRHLDRLLDDPL